MTVAGGKVPRVSVLVPAFNSAPYLPAALDSILVQTFTDIEVLVVDDGSTDGTRQALEPYAGRIRYEYHDNRGIGRTRNRALALARGELVAFLDSDDLWDPDHLAIKVRALDQHPDLGGVFGEFRIIDSNGATATEQGTTTQFKVFDREGVSIDSAFQNRATIEADTRTVPLYHGQIFDTMFLGNFVLPTSLVMRRAAALSVGEFLDMRTQEDYEYLLRFARQYAFGFIPEPFVSYRRHATQLTAYGRVESIVTAASEIVDRYEAEFRARGRMGLFNRRKAGLCTTLGAVYLRQGKMRAARASIAEGIRRSPTNPRPYADYVLSLVPHRLLAMLRGW